MPRALQGQRCLCCTQVPAGTVMGMPRPGAACPRGLGEVLLLGGTHVTAAACTRGAGCSCGWIRPTHCPAVRGACVQQLICCARGRGCSRSPDAPEEGTKAGAGKGEAPSPQAATELPQQLQAWAQLWTAEDGTALQVQKQICLPNSYQVPESGDGDTALIRWLWCYRLTSFYSKLPPHL